MAHSGIRWQIHALGPCTATLGVWASGYLKMGGKGFATLSKLPKLPNEKVSKEQRPVGTIEAGGMQEEMGLPAPVIPAVYGFNSSWQQPLGVPRLPNAPLSLLQHCP